MCSSLEVVQILYGNIQSKNKISFQFHSIKIFITVFLAFDMILECAGEAASSTAMPTCSISALRVFSELAAQWYLHLHLISHGNRGAIIQLCVMQPAVLPPTQHS